MKYVFPENDYRDYLQHAWNNHKYAYIKNGRYYYPEDLKSEEVKTSAGPNIIYAPKKSKYTSGSETVVSKASKSKKKSSSTKSKAKAKVKAKLKKKMQESLDRAVASSAIRKWQKASSAEPSSASITGQIRSRKRG